MHTRRAFIQTTTLGGLTLYLGLDSILGGTGGTSAMASPVADADLAAISPIDRSLGDVAPRKYFGDNPTKAHAALWDVSSIDARFPKRANDESRRLVIVGGGLSGLLTAYLLRDHNPLLLEQAERFGGNSKGQAWKGIDYALGAAYICKPEAGSETEALLKELGLNEIAREKAGEGPVLLGGKLATNFWDGTLVSDAAAKKQFETLHRYFRDLNAGTVPYPEIPYTSAEEEAVVRSLDAVSFLDHLRGLVGGTLHPLLHTAIEHYCWSSFAASASEVSAAAGLNFYASEFGELLVFPGGNAAIGERIVERLSAKLSPGSLRTEALVYRVETARGTSGKEEVRVSYLAGDGTRHTVTAERVVVACPKFVAGRFLVDVEPKRLEAFRAMRYRAYLVANVLLKKPLQSDFYDLYMLGEGKEAPTSSLATSKKQRVTDVVSGTFSKKSAERAVLTLYRGLPYDGGRAEIFDENSYSNYRAEFEEQVQRDILPSLGFAVSDVVDVRIARWGHPLPVAAVGLISGNLVQRAHEPIGDRVYFVEQDNWALPAFETSVTEAFKWSAVLSTVLA